MRGFRFWHGRSAVSPSSEEQQQRELVTASGATHAPEDDKLELKKLTAKCLRCKKFMGPKDGFQLFVSDNHRIHVDCFAKMIDKAIKDNPDDPDVLSTVLRPKTEGDS